MKRRDLLSDAPQQFVGVYAECVRDAVQQVQVNAPSLVVLKVVDDPLTSRRTIRQRNLREAGAFSEFLESDAQLHGRRLLGGRHTAQPSKAQRPTLSRVRQPDAPPIIFVAEVRVPMIGPIRAAVGELLTVWPAHSECTIRVCDPSGARILRSAYVPPKYLDMTLQALVREGVIDLFRIDGSRVGTIAEGY